MAKSRDVVAEDPRTEARTANWVAFVICAALLFDGYDLVVYGTVLPGLLADPTQIGAFDAAAAGLLGSWALIGVLVGSLICGAVGDFFGRRRPMLLGITWFSVGMFITALTTTVEAFGAMRFITGVGLGIVLASAGATMAEFAPAGRRQFYNAIVYSGIPAGGVFASIMGILFLNNIGWRGLFMIGALPLVLLVPIAWFRLPESPRWLLARGREEEAQAAARRTGVPLMEERLIRQLGAAPQKAGFAAVFSSQFALPSILLGMMSFSGLLLTYGLNTWLPKIMEGYGYGRTYALFFPLALNLGAVAGGLLLSRFADKRGPQRVIAFTFVVATISLVLMTFGFPLPLLFLCIAIAGVGTLGTQVLVYGFQSNYYTTNARAAGVAWCASVGRCGGILGPIIGGWLAVAGIGGATAFYIFGGVALVGAVVTVLVPHQRKLEEAEHKVEEMTEHPSEDHIAATSTTHH
ncbi:aromatic acid/H+ symport family MFS transporter [Arthrobacter sp. IA7]|uniref:MFS transporter n=1 Tax=Arthrobacter ipis TaxID=2716202 RepID=UPI0016822063|nr:aromatic acid/H+ symport family MFS transporter [Arthrobacter ipis]MBD1544569.1 aromatic acid/H+ symport family MFS transporter [Arthrobacter ipis]